RDKLVTGVQTCALPIYVPHAVAGLQPMHRRYSVRSGYGAQDNRGDDAVPAVGAGESHHRFRSGRLDGTQKTGRLFLSATLLESRSEERRVGKEWRDRRA